VDGTECSASNGVFRVGDGKGRTSEMLWEDEEWCGAVAEFIM